jgi:glycosyltransferase involved in cell wall biosynthesis
MKLLIVDPNVSLTSPSMKGVVRSLPRFKELGFEIEVWCWYCDDGLPIDRIVKLPALGRLHTIGGYVFALWARLRAWWLFSKKRQPRPDLVYTIAWYLPDCDVCHVQFSPFDWELRQRVLGIKSLRDVYERVVNLVTLVMARHFLKTTTARLFIPASDAVANDLREEGLETRIQVLPNSYDAARFHEGVRAQYREATRKQLNLQPGDRVFVFASAGHYRRKGFFLAVEALKIVRQRHPQVKLLVVGGTPARLQALQDSLDKSHPDWREWMVFSGMVSDVERYYAAGDAFLFPSYSEAFALVEVEAAASGLPLFLTRHHGSEMILDDGRNGRFMEFDPVQMAEVIEPFVTGAWQPGDLHVHAAMDSETYARRLADELVMTAATKPRNEVQDV